MPATSPVLLQPRKAPVQARSASSVEAILDATLQVLLSVGKERLTTTRVALRAGVSVGTLYQYFPNKGSLLQAVLRRHMDEVTDAVDGVCEREKGKSLAEMATALVHSFLGAKMRDARISAALYAVSADVEGAKIAQQLGARSNKAIEAMLRSSPEAPGTDLQLVASMLWGAMAGVSRRLLESPSPEKQLAGMRQELIFLVSSYLEACSARTPSASR